MMDSKFHLYVDISFSFTGTTVSFYAYIGPNEICFNKQQNSTNLQYDLFFHIHDVTTYQFYLELIVCQRYNI